MNNLSNYYIYLNYDMYFKGKNTKLKKYKKLL